MKFSNAPASIGDVAITIAETYQLDEEFPGVPLSHLDEMTKRDRMYLWYQIEPGKPYEPTIGALPRVSRYRILGPLIDADSWVLPSPIHLDKAPSRLTMDEPDFARLAWGFSIRENKKRASRWVEGVLARVYLSFPNEGQAKLVFDTYLPPSISGQSLQVSINDKVLAKLKDTDLAGAVRHEIPIPSTLKRKDINIIEFRMAKAVKFRADGRYLSIIFTYIGVEPVD